ncbi:hypothetical protein [uncultured Sphingomonas sp.]|uniref:hypothetical protein n=1 Tax=uncultured Sphingomonas sp. TaxID=158754 RepID=UPI0035CB1021
MIDMNKRRNRTRQLGGLALFAIACAVSPSVRELVSGQPVTEPAAMSLLSFCLACVALALVIRSAIGDGGGRVRTGEGRHADAWSNQTRAGRGARGRPLRQDPGRD